MTAPDLMALLDNSDGPIAPFADAVYVWGTDLDGNHIPGWLTTEHPGTSMRTPVFVAKETNAVMLPHELSGVSVSMQMIDFERMRDLVGQAVRSGYAVSLRG
jgi:hypothetical protein